MCELDFLSPASIDARMLASMLAGDRTQGDIMELAQLNARIGLQVKREGDAVLARAGVSATEAIRALWSYLAETGQLPGFMSTRQEEPIVELSPNESAAAEGAGMALAMAKEHGLAATLESLSYGDLRELAFDEMVSEGVYRV